MLFLFVFYGLVLSLMVRYELPGPQRTRLQSSVLGPNMAAVLFYFLKQSKTIYPKPTTWLGDICTTTKHNTLVAAARDLLNHGLSLNLARAFWNMGPCRIPQPAEMVLGFIFKGTVLASLPGILGTYHIVTIKSYHGRLISSKNLAKGLLTSNLGPTFKASGRTRQKVLGPMS